MRITVVFARVVPADRLSGSSLTPGLESTRESDCEMATCHASSGDLQDGSSGVRGRSGPRSAAAGPPPETPLTTV